MKILLMLLALMVATDPVGATFSRTTAQAQSLKPTQSSPPPFSLAISVADKVVKVGSLIDLKIIKKNISIQDWGVYRIVGSAEAVYDIVVTDADSNPVAENAYGRKIHGKEPDSKWSPRFSAMTITLKPGDTLDEHIYLNEVYDLDRPGKYIIQVSQTMYASVADEKAGLKSVIKSNSVALTVTN